MLISLIPILLDKKYSIVLVH